MRILWHSTVPWSPSSYSVLTARTVPELVKAGHEVVLSTWYGLSGAPMPWQIGGNGNGQKPKTVTILPHHQVGGNVYGEGVMVESYRHFKSDVLITVCDVFVFPPAETGKTNFAPWLPVDLTPIPAAMLKALEPAIYPMCYSRWGTGELERAGVKAHYVPCSAPADLFMPGDQQEARAKFTIGKPYDFLVAMVAANKDSSDRKGFSEALQGFAKFLKTHPDAMLYVHTDWGGPVKVAQIAQSLGIEKSIIQPDQYSLIMGMLGEKYMRDVYRAADVLLNPAKSEGFGLPLVEAQMCGCPIIATDFATTDELLSAGWKLPGQLDWYMGAEAWRFRVDVDGIADALTAAYDERGNAKLKAKARKGVVKYDTPAVFTKYWRPALKEIDTLINVSRIAIPGVPNVAG